MGRSPEIDAYIARQAEFARPILEHLREVVHEACPEVEEALKWSSPSFLYRGKILCGGSAFKAHVTFGFWHAALVEGEERGAGLSPANGRFSRLTSVSDLPPDAELIAMIAKAKSLIDEGVKPPHITRERTAKPEPAVPVELRAALDRNPKAAAAFDGFAPSHRREYVEWIAEAKRPETRERRVNQAVEWLSEGKKRNWKYENC